MFETESLAGASESADVACQPTLSVDEAKDLAERHCKGLVLEQGLRVRTHYSVKTVAYRELVFYPFWIACVQRGGRYDFHVVDAVSGDVEGARIRKICLRAFRLLD